MKYFTDARPQALQTASWAVTILVLGSISVQPVEPKMLKTLSSAMTAGSILCVLAVATGPPASALDRHIQFTNTTRLVIVELYASHVGTGNWQQDILGEAFLQPGNSLLININDGAGFCRFDFKVVFDNGAALVRRDINICEVGEYALSYR